ncbi:hypothetical protein [Parasitella parasitica]|uniref:WH1 domain-containing protein n=1 Tax=Parasitella parasitica TaxID=35722 RepID=A0A0B7NTH1_9FUNG|nr:hypothetical protein [Parasitella parasitica]
MRSVTLSSPKDKDLVRKSVPNSKIFTAGVARLYVASPDPSKWTYSQVWGAAIFCIDKAKNSSFFIRLVDIQNNSGVIWEQELYEGFNYNKDASFFHSFETDDCLTALEFVDEGEADVFFKKVQGRDSLSAKTSSASANSFGGSGHGKTPSFSMSSKRRSKIDKNHIGMPADFRHVGHIGYTPGKGFSVQNNDPEWNGIFEQLKELGISADEINDNQEFIQEFLQQNGTTLPPSPPPQQKKQSAITAPPPAPTSRKKAPPPPPPPGRHHAPPPPPPPRRSNNTHSSPPPPPPPPVRNTGPPVPNRGRPVPAPPPAMNNGYNASPAAAAAAPPPPPPPPAAPPQPPMGNIPAPPPPPPMMNNNAPPPPPPPPMVNNSANVPAPPPPPPSMSSVPPAAASGDGRSNLMASIRAAGGFGTLKSSGKLREADNSSPSTPSMNHQGSSAATGAAAGAAGGTLASSLADVLKQRKQAMQSDDEDDEDDEWE